MDVRLPDGTVVTNVPDGITQTELMARVQRSQKKPLEQIDVNGPQKQEMSVMEGIGGGLLNLGMGAVRGASRIGNTVVGTVMGDRDERNKSIESFFQENADPESLAFKVGDVGTQVAGTAGIGGALGKGVMAVSQSPKAMAVADALTSYGIGRPAVIAGPPTAAAAAKGAMSASPEALGLIGRSAAGTVAGGATAAAVDPESWKSGAVIGGVLPPTLAAGGKVLDFGKNITGPLSEQWRTSQARTYLNDMLGDAKQKVINAIQKGDEGRTTVSDLIAGANVGKTDKFGSPLVAVQEQLERLPGGISDAAKSVEAAQEAGRIARLRGVTPIQPIAEKVREKVTGPMYEAVEKSTKPVDISGVADRVNDILSKNVGNPELKSVLNTIKTGLSDSAQNFGFGPSMTQANAKRVSSVIDGLKAAIANKENAYIKQNLISLRDELKSVLPGYKAADTEFARLSAPINQAKVIDEMVNVLSGQGGPERVTAFKNVLGRGESALLKRSSGNPRFDSIDEVLTGPGQRSAKDRVAFELDRELEKRALSKNVDTQYLFDIAEKGKGSISIPNLLSRPAMALNFAMKKFGQGADEMIAKDMAMLMVKDPAAFSAKYLADVPPNQRQIVMEQLKQQFLTPTTGASFANMAAQGEQQ